MTRTSASIDAFGRIVIPKSTRTRYALDPGATVEIEESPLGIVLRPADLESPLRRKGRVLVFTGDAAGALETRVQLDRAERARHLTPRARR